MTDTARTRHDHFEALRCEDPPDLRSSDAVNREAVAPVPARLTDVALVKQAMRRLPGGVVIVTAGSGDERVGFTATSALSLSLDPPTMLVCVNRASSTLPTIRRRRHFCINVLGSDHQAIAERFAGIGTAEAVRGAARYHGADWVVLPSGTSGLVGAQAIIDCRLDEAIERHSHCILLGAVCDVRVDGDVAASLVYRIGQFAGLPLPS